MLKKVYEQVLTERVSRKQHTMTVYESDTEMVFSITVPKDRVKELSAGMMGMLTKAGFTNLKHHSNQTDESDIVTYTMSYKKKS